MNQEKKSSVESGKLPHTPGVVGRTLEIGPLRLARLPAMTTVFDSFPLLQSPNCNAGCVNLPHTLTISILTSILSVETQLPPGFS